MHDRVVIVGASLAGVRVAKALRRKEYAGEIVLVGDEPELPYDRPPLSKQFLTSPRELPPKLLEPESFFEGLDMRLGRRAEKLSLSDQSVVLDDGSTLVADHVVVATGATARSLPALPDGPRVARLRTLADARKVRTALGSIHHLLVVGGGFIGCEVAAAARKRGVAVTIVEPLEAPVVRGIGLLVGGMIAELHRDNGVDLRFGVAVETVEQTSDLLRITLTDGSRIETQFAVVGVGARAQTDWLEGSGLNIDNGVLCDAQCAAIGGGGHVWAAGDVASWPSARYGHSRRMEHWTNAAEQASAVASGILGTPAGAYDPVPYVWSDQYQHKFQILGSVRGDDDVTVLRGSVEDRRFAIGYSQHGILRGVVACDMPAEIALMRPHIAQSAPLLAVAS